MDIPRGTRNFMGTGKSHGNEKNLSDYFNKRWINEGWNITYYATKLTFFILWLNLFIDFLRDLYLDDLCSVVVRILSLECAGFGFHPQSGYIIKKRISMLKLQDK